MYVGMQLEHCIVCTYYHVCGYNADSHCEAVCVSPTPLQLTMSGAQYREWVTQFPEEVDEQ